MGSYPAMNAAWQAALVSLSWSPMLVLGWWARRAHRPARTSVPPSPEVVRHEQLMQALGGTQVR